MYFMHFCALHIDFSSPNINLHPFRGNITSVGKSCSGENIWNSNSHPRTRFNIPFLWVLYIWDYLGQHQTRFPENMSRAHILRTAAELKVLISCFYLNVYLIGNSKLIYHQDHLHITLPRIPLPISIIGLSTLLYSQYVNGS